MLVRAYANLVLRESLDAALHHLLPEIELVVDEPEQEPEIYDNVWLWIIFNSYLLGPLCHKLLLRAETRAISR